jgi:hypothetical protein
MQEHRLLEATNKIQAGFPSNYWEETRDGSLTNKSIYFT